MCCIADICCHPAYCPPSPSVVYTVDRGPRRWNFWNFWSPPVALSSNPYGYRDYGHRVVPGSAFSGHTYRPITHNPIPHRFPVNVGYSQGSHGNLNFGGRVVPGVSVGRRF